MAEWQSAGKVEALNVFEGMRGNNPESPQESRQSGVQTWATNLQMAVEECRERFVLLTKRLEAVLSVEPSTPSKPEGSTPDRLVPLASFLWTQTIQLKQLSERIGSVIRRVEV